MDALSHPAGGHKFSRFDRIRGGFVDAPLVLSKRYFALSVYVA